MDENTARNGDLTLMGVVGNNSINQISQQAQQSTLSVAEGADSKKCPLCERVGIPILPVRYAVCRRTQRNSAVNELPEARIADFTTVPLDQEWTEDGKTSRVEKCQSNDILEDIEEVSQGKVSKYILRQLRSGYLYIYDQANEPNSWYCFVVTTDGKFYQYSVADNPPNPEKAEFDCGLKPEKEKREKSLSASVVTIPTIKKDSVLYYAYSEHPWSRNHLKMIQGDASWRKRNMQKIDMLELLASSSAKHCPHVFDMSELNYVAEFCNLSTENDDFFWPNGFVNSPYTPDQLIESMKDRLHVAPSWLKDKPIIMAVKDEVGIIDELNAYRLETVERMRKYLADNNNENQRKLVFMNAIDAFSKNFEIKRKAAVNEKWDQKETWEVKHKASLQRQIGHADISSKSEFNTQSERKEYLKRKEKLQNDINNINAGLKEGRAEDLKEVDELTEQHRQQMAGYYDSSKLLAQYDKQDDKLKAFRMDYQKQCEKIERLSQVYDSDYACWIDEHLRDLLARYSAVEFTSGIALSGIITGLFSGGVLSTGSAALWKGFAENIKSRDSVIVTSLFFNDADLVDAAVKTISSCDKEAGLSVDEVDTWAKLYRSKKEQYNSQELSVLDSNIQLILTTLIGTVGNAVSGLALQKDQASIDAVKVFRLYCQCLYLSQVNVGDERACSLKFKKMTLTISQYRDWLVSTGHGLRSDKIKAQADKEMPYPDGAGGNIAINSAIPGDKNIDVVFPVIDYDNSGIDIFDTSDSEDRNDTANDGAIKQGADFIATDSISSLLNFSGEMPIGKSIAASIVISQSISTLYDQLLDKDADAEVGEIISALCDMVMSSNDIYNNVLDIRAGAVSTANLSSVIGGLRSNFFKLTPAGVSLWGGLLGVVSNTISIIDGFRKISQASHDEMLGLSSEMTANRNILGNLSITSGVLGLIGLVAAGPALVAAGAFLGIISLVLGYKYVDLVAKSVWMWINLSYMGNHKGQIEAFSTSDNEVASLQSVFKGLTVDIAWENVYRYDDAFGREHAAQVGVGPRYIYQSGNAKKIFLSILIPTIDTGGLSITLLTSQGDNESSKRHFSYNYIKSAIDSSFEPLAYDFSQGGSDAPELIIDESGYLFSNSSLIDNEHAGTKIALVVSLRDDITSKTYNSTYLVEVV
ncbi:T6SS effector BTH_I2691 family protein [Cobetia marina]|uniref:T6SS effector BTH_I2691 family protein n=1 Tax=Cobetia marina TaxID=28258 RepID=UPI0026E1CFE0|nr:T6SS effector BTH_I2691 family protein [Cobetia marina]MDO6788225.1 T6SS effector BTH_I2691 family protein [Cobetia marina]